MAETVGVVGLGAMGLPMLQRIVGAGFDVVAYDISADSVSRASDAGATIAASPKEVGDRADIVLASLPTPSIVKNVVLGQDGLSSGTRMRTYIDVSTTGRTAAAEVASALAAQGVAVVDAPVSGGAAGALAGTLTIMVAGDTAAVAAAQPVLEALASRVVLVGDTPGQAQVVKLANNMVSATALAATAEALALATAAGVDANVFIDVLNSSSGQSNASSQKFPKHILPRTFDFGFKLGLMNKDVGLGIEEARAARIPSLVLTATSELLAIASAELGAAADATEIIRTIETWVGRPITTSTESTPNS